MEIDPRKPPSLGVAYQIADDLDNNRTGQTRANGLRSVLRIAEAWMREMAAIESRPVEPQLLVDLEMMYSALRGSDIDGKVEMLVLSPGKDRPGRYKVVTEYGDFLGEGAQLTNTIRLLGEAIALRPAPDVDEAQDEFAAEHGE